MVKRTHISRFPVSAGRVFGIGLSLGVLFAFLGLGKCDNTCDIHTTIIRQVENTGFHRDIHSLVEIITSHPALSEECRIVLVETLPSGLYVNPDQLADFRRLERLQACPTERVDVELPQRNASPSTVHVYSVLNRTENLLSAKIVLPVHLRYHNPSEHGGYAPVTLLTPSLLMKCDVDVPCIGPNILAPCGPCSQDLCQWLNVTYKTNSPKFLLLVPVGNIGHHPLVIIVTLLVTCGGCFYILSSVLA